MNFIQLKRTLIFCAGCGSCEEVCPYDAINLVNGLAQVERSLCEGCGLCVGINPVRAISLE